jgi:hypothetical protein
MPLSRPIQRRQRIDPAGAECRKLASSMTTRTSRETVTFGNPFSLKGIGRILPAGSYDVVTYEELIEELSFPAYRRQSTMMLVPMNSTKWSSVEMIAIDPLDLTAAKGRDAPSLIGGTTPVKAS